jgi:flagellar protein FlaG
MPSDSLAITTAARPASPPVQQAVLAQQPAAGTAGVAPSAAGSPTLTAAGVGQASPSAGSSADAPATDPAAKPDAASLKKAVAALNDSIQPHFGSIEFSIDEQSGKTLLKIVDTETNTLLMQIPSKQALALASAQDAGTRQGLFIKDSA